MKIKETKRIVNMLDQEWDLGKRKAKAYKKTCAWIYWFDILSEAEKIIVKKDNGSVVGVCGYTKYKSYKYQFRKKFYKQLKNILMHSFLVKDKKALEKYYQNYNYLVDEIKKRAGGEITILIVDKDYRKQKYGYELITETFKLAKKDGLRKILILSDESCNYSFYEQLNCKKIFKQEITDFERGKPQTTEQAFIYEKNLDEVYDEVNE